MPLYEYQCTQCGERKEVLQKFSDPPYSHCPKCSGAMKKLLSSPAIQFKGSGFYKTDYASKSSPAPSSKGESSKGESSKSDSSSGETSKAETSKGDSSKNESSTSSGSTETRSEAKPKSEAKSSD